MLDSEHLTSMFRYRLGDAESPDESSDEEEITVARKPTPRKTPSASSSKGRWRWGYPPLEWSRLVFYSLQKYMSLVCASQWHQYRDPSKWTEA